jgi:hypothetical protein
MALTFNKVPDGFDVWGKTYVNIFDVVLDNSYPLSTGYVINAQDVGLKGLKGAQVVGGNKAAGAVLAWADLAPASTGAVIPTSLALRVFLPTGGATAPATLTAPVVAASVTGAITVAGTATGTIPAGGTTVTSTAANGAIVSVPAAGLTASAAAGTAGAVTAGIGKEVGNTTDLSALIVRVMFFGQ